VLVGHCIEDSIRRGLREFDFLRGPEAYKSHWTSTQRETVTLVLTAPGRALPWARQRARRAVRAAKSVAKRVLVPSTRPNGHER
jgi:CelD/BcsL family acetyltransferase involved in cellulose biosynthesis